MQEKIQKYAGDIARGSISLIPIIGSLTVELLDDTIPNQRQERIEKLLKILSQKISNISISEEELKNKFHSKDFIDIFEDVLRQSVRATSDTHLECLAGDTRLEYLASVLKNGIDSQKFDHLQNKRLLEILEKINDIEVILLRSYSLRDDTSEYQKFINKYPDILKDQQVFIRHYGDNLISLGLVGVNELIPTMMKPSLTTELLPTRLGVNLLQLIGFEQLELDGQDSEKRTRVAESINNVDLYRALLEKYRNIQSSAQESEAEAYSPIGRGY